MGLLREGYELILLGDELVVSVASWSVGMAFLSLFIVFPLGESRFLLPPEDLRELLRGVDDLLGFISRSSPPDSSLGGERASTLESRLIFDPGRKYDGRVFFTESASLVLSICLKDTAPRKFD